MNQAFVPISDQPKRGSWHSQSVDRCRQQLKPTKDAPPAKLHIAVFAAHRGIQGTCPTIDSARRGSWAACPFEACSPYRGWHLRLPNRAASCAQTGIYCNFATKDSFSPSKSAAIEYLPCLASKKGNGLRGKAAQIN